MSADAGESGDETAERDGGEREPYVHRPEGEPASSTVPAAGDDSGLGFRGQVLVVAVVLATLVIPGIIYLYPELLADRVPFLVAMLVLPLVPAFLLGAAAVWAMAGRQ